MFAREPGRERAPERRPDTSPTFESVSLKRLMTTDPAAAEKLLAEYFTEFSRSERPRITGIISAKEDLLKKLGERELLTSTHATGTFDVHVHTLKGIDPEGGVKIIGGAHTVNLESINRPRYARHILTLWGNLKDEQIKSLKDAASKAGFDFLIEDANRSRLIEAVLKSTDALYVPPFKSAEPSEFTSVFRALNARPSLTLPIGIIEATYSSEYGEAHPIVRSIKKAKENRAIKPEELRPLRGKGRPK